MNPLHFTLKKISTCHNKYLKKHSPPKDHVHEEQSSSFTEDMWQDLHYHEEQSYHYSCLFRGGVLLSYTLGFLSVVFAVIPISGILGERITEQYELVFVLLELFSIAVIIAIYISGMSNKKNRPGSFLFQDWHGNWQRHRTFSEILRYQSLIAWLKPENVISKYQIPKSVLATTTTSDDTMLQNLQKILAEQQSYNTQKSSEYHFIQHRLHYIAKWSFILTLFCCLAHFIVHFPALSALSAILPALGSCCHGIASTAEYEKLAQQCHQTKCLLDALAKRLILNEKQLLSDDKLLRNEVSAFLNIVMEDRDKWYIFTSSSKLPL